MPNNGITDYIKNAFQEKGYVTKNEISALGAKRPESSIHWLRKKGRKIRTVITSTDVEYHLEDEGGVTPEPELKQEPPKGDKRWDKLKELIDIQVDFMGRVGNKESTGVKTLIWIQDLMEDIEKEENNG